MGSECQIRSTSLCPAWLILSALAQASRERHEAVADLISVIVTTYEREDALDAVLRSLSRQSDRGFEVIVACLLYTSDAADE